MKVISERPDYDNAIKATTTAFFKFIREDISEKYPSEYALLNRDEHAIIELYRYILCEALSLKSALNYKELVKLIKPGVAVVSKELRLIDLGSTAKRTGFLQACVHTIKFVSESTFYDKTGRR